jgi:hypothetical protein
MLAYIKNNVFPWSCSVIGTIITNIYDNIDRFISITCGIMTLIYTILIIVKAFRDLKKK